MREGKLGTLKIYYLEKHNTKLFYVNIEMTTAPVTCEEQCKRIYKWDKNSEIY